MPNKKGWLELDAAEIGRPRRLAKNPILSAADFNGESVSSLLEFVCQDMYDYAQCQVATQTQLMSFFNQPQGQNAINLGGATFAKNALHTNLTGTGGVLVNPQSFLVTGLAVIRIPNIHPSDLINLDYTSLVTFTVGDTGKVYFLGLLAKIPSSTGIFGSNTGAALTATASFVTEGWPVTHNVYSLLAGSTDKGVVINQGQNFGMTIDPTRGSSGVGFTTLAAGSPQGTGFQIWPTLVGILARGAQ